MINSLLRVKYLEYLVYKETIGNLYIRGLYRLKIFFFSGVYVWIWRGYDYACTVSIAFAAYSCDWTCKDKQQNKISRQKNILKQLCIQRKWLL